MTSKQIEKDLIENRNQFLFSINRTVLGYDQAIKMIDRIDAIVAFFQEKLPDKIIEPNWEPDPEYYEGGTIWINIYFDFNDEKHHKVSRAGSDLRKKYRDKFPEESKIIQPLVKFNEEPKNETSNLTNIR